MPERKKLITRTVAKVQSPYGAGLNKKKNIAPLVKPKRRTKSEPPHVPSTAKETIPTDQKGNNYDCRYMVVTVMCNRTELKV